MYKQTHTWTHISEFPNSYKIDSGSLFKNPFHLPDVLCTVLSTMWFIIIPNFHSGFYIELYENIENIVLMPKKFETKRQTISLYEVSPACKCPITN